MEELLLSAFEILTMATNEYANVIEQTTEIIKLLEPEKDKYNELVNQSFKIRAKINQLQIAEERLELAKKLK